MSYVLPIRAAHPVSEELLGYLATLSTLEPVAQVIAVDGSADSVFTDFSVRCSPAVQHVRVDEDLRALANGKVAGVLTGVRRASHPYLVIADEDVRYDSAALVELCRLLDHADIVRPQNYFDPLPWHACLDTARTLINRVTGGDWPGTFGVRRAMLDRTGGYDGNVLFENLELVRTVTAAGGRESRPLNLFVKRLPPRTHHFWSQRVRQAYDEFARPARLAAWLTVLPALVVAIAKLRFGTVAVSLALPVIVAEAGRRVGHGTRVFPFLASMAAPVWVLERAVCAWGAVAARVLLGGVPYGGRILERAATPYAVLRRKYRSIAPSAQQTVATVRRAEGVPDRARG